MARCTHCRQRFPAIMMLGAVCLRCDALGDGGVAELRGPHGIVRASGRAPERIIGRIPGEPSNALDVVAYFRRNGIET